MLFKFDFKIWVCLYVTQCWVKPQHKQALQNYWVITITIKTLKIIRGLPLKPKWHLRPFPVAARDPFLHLGRANPPLCDQRPNPIEYKADINSEETYTSI